MMQRYAGLKPINFALIALVALCSLSCAARAAERVQFQSARYQIGPLQRRLALERREPILPQPADTIDGYLTKPQGPGPFPAIVHLHGCGGLAFAVTANTADHFWAKRLAAWGYAVLVVDSFTPRRIVNTCSGEYAPRVADAYGALAWLARQPFVDPARVGVIGFSAGGIATLSIAELRDFELFEEEAAHHFKAAVAFYPACVMDGNVKIPTLILIGESDDWTPAAACKGMMKRRRSESPVTLIVYPGAHHVFDAPRAQGRRYFGHWLEYNAVAAEQASEEVRRFLAEFLAR
jgi:dienelactone hydrolase